jgi:hypothetical protein
MENVERKMPDFARAFTYMFEDKDWLPKFLVGAAFVLLSAVAIGLPFLLGYCIAAIQRSYEGREVPLAEWDDFGSLLSKGVAGFVILVALFIPGLLFIILPSGLLLTLCYWVLAMFVAPIPLGRYAVTGDLNAAFDLAEIVSLVKDNVANLAAVLIIWIVFSFIAIMGVLALGIGFLFTAFYANLGLCFLVGKVYREAMRASEAQAGENQASTSG